MSLIRLGLSSSGVHAPPLLGTPALLIQPPHRAPTLACVGHCQAWCVHSIRGARALQGCGDSSWVDSPLSEVLTPPWPPCPGGAWVPAD